MQVTLTDLTAYVRGLDERLRNVVNYTDEALHDKIRYGIHNLAAQCQPFVKEEWLSLQPYFDVDLLQFNIVPTHEILGYLSKEFYSTSDNINYNKVILTDITLTEELNNSLSFSFTVEPPSGLYFKMRYFYAPDILVTPTLEVEPEVWHFMKHSIQIVVWGALKDYEKEQYHQKVLDTHVSQKILQQPKGETPTDMKGGFV